MLTPFLKVNDLNIKVFHDAIDNLQNSNGTKITRALKFAIKVLNLRK